MFESGLSGHIQKVYLMLCLELITSAMGISVGFHHDVNQWMVFGVQVGLIILIACTTDIVTKAFFTLLATFVSGLSLSEFVLDIYLDDPSIIETTLITTSILFFCLFWSTVLNGPSSHVNFGNYLFAGLISMIITHLLYAIGFIGIQLTYLIIIYGGLVLMCCYVIYDTQKMIDNYNSGVGDFVLDSYNFYLDFISIAIRIARIISDNKKKNTK